MHSPVVYPSAPVALMIAQVQHVSAARLDRDGLLAIREEMGLADWILKFDRRINVELPSGQQTQTVVPKLIARSLDLTLGFEEEALTLETTAYPGWPRVRELFASAVAARQTVSPVDGYLRLGLRYIDEIRVPTLDDEVDWPTWIDSALVGPAGTYAQLGLGARQQQGVAMFDGLEPGDAYAMRYGAMDRAPVVPSAESLVRRPLPEPGPFFLLDIDGSWTRQSDGEIPRLDSALRDTADRLHDPIRSVFELSVTERYREEVLNSERGE